MPRTTMEFPDYRVVYRHPAPGEALQGVSAVGFMHKPTARSAQYDITYPVYVAVYVLRGTGRYVDCNGTVTPLQAGDLIQRFPGRWHSTIQDPDGLWAECFFELHPHVFQALAKLGIADGHTPVLHPGLDHSLIARFEGLIHLLQTGTARAMGRCFLQAQELLADLTTAARAREDGGHEQSLIEQACQIISEDPGAREELPALAESLGISYDRFRKLFRQQIGITPGDYRIHRRIDAARSLLQQGTLSIKEIALELGYPDVYVFSKQFRAIVGLPPGEYQKQTHGL